MLKLSSLGASGRVMSRNFWSKELDEELVLMTLLVEDLRLLLKCILGG